MEKIAEEIKERILKKGMEGVTEISIKKVLKNNSVTLTALVFVDEESNVTPTIYLDHYYELYVGGAELDDIAEEIINAYRESRVNRKLDFSFMRDWEQVKSKVAFKLINKERNQELLQQIPHKDILDLSMVFYLSLNEGEATVLIYNSHCEMWKIEVEELVRVAEENTPRICPMCLKNMNDVVRELLGKGVEESTVGNVDMYVLSNVSGVFGAAAILYPNSMEIIAEKLQSDFYLLPSSVHETIIVPATEDDEPQKLIDMVREVNGTSVRTDEVLGDNVYFYYRGRRDIELIS